MELRHGSPRFQRILWLAFSAALSAIAIGSAKIIEAAQTPAAPAGEVLLAGGEDRSGGVVATSVLYNPKTNTFASSSGMNTAREFSMVMALTKGSRPGTFAGQVLIAGGRDGLGNTLASTELYDPFLGVFAPASDTPTMNTARSDGVAMMLVKGPNRGKILITGGSNDSGPLASTELYDPIHNSFAPAAQTVSMNTPREFAVAALLTTGPNAGKILIAGGYNDNGLLASTELYDPVTNSFAPPSATATMNTARAFATASSLMTGPTKSAILIAGGSGSAGPLASVELYDPVHNSFAPASATPMMNNAREFAVATVLVKGKNAGKALIAGGANDDGALASTELYDPVHNSFAPASATAVMNDVREFASAATLATGTNAGKVLIAGGTDDSGPLSSTELYDPVANAFAPASQTASIGDARRYGVMIALSPEAAHGALNGPSPTPTPTPSIVLTPADATVAKGNTLQLHATQGGKDITTSATWASSDTTVATLSNAGGSQGLATAQNAGFVTVSATLNGVQGVTTLAVTPAALTSITVGAANGAIPQGTKEQFTATGNYSDGTTMNITNSVVWASSASTVAPISNAAGSQGMVSAVSVGFATITATLNTPQGGIQGTAGLNVNPPALTAIAVSPASAVIPKGGTQQFTATGSFTDGSTQDVTGSVTWSSSNVSVAVISNGPSPGLATAVGAVGVGPTAITASSGGVQGTAMASVGAAVLASITVTPANPPLVLTRTQQFTATGNFTDGSTQNLTTSVLWASSDGTVATISNVVGSQGLVMPVAFGTATVAAISGSIEGTTSLTVGPPVLIGIAVTPANPSIQTSADLQFTATGSFNDGSFQDLTTQVNWGSSDNTIATVSNAAGKNGVATGVGGGTATITASLNGIQGSTMLAVRAVTLVSTNVTPASVTLPVGTTQQFTATGTFSDSTTGDVTYSSKWTSAAKAIATVSATGLATGQSSGSTTIKATLSGISGQASVTVP